MPLLTPETAIAIVGTLGGGALVKLVDRYYSLKEKTVDSGIEFRTELHARIAELLVQLKAEQAERTSWQEKYYALIAAGAMRDARITLLEDKARAGCPVCKTRNDVQLAEE